MVSSRSIVSMLTISVLLSLTDTVYTSGIDPLTTNSNEIIDSIKHDISKTQDMSESQSSSGSKVNHTNDRPRSGRAYQQAGRNHYSAPLETYASYANALGPEQGSASVSANQQATNEASAYSSFGETSPTSSNSLSGSLVSASAARQLSASNDYSPQSNHYYASYMSPSTDDASHSVQPNSNYPTGNDYIQNHYYKSASSQVPLGYPTNIYERGHPISNQYDRFAHHRPSFSASLLNPSFHSGGLMSSASHALSHWTNGFSIGEIICGLVALTIGAVILGAPFFLIYLVLMGNFSGSGTLSLTNPTSTAGAAGGAATTANGRRKRLAVFEAMNLNNDKLTQHQDLDKFVKSLANNISPFIDLQQVSRTFRHLVSAIEKYSSKSQQ